MNKSNLRLIGVAAAASFALAGCATPGSGYGSTSPSYNSGSSYGNAPAGCYDCGVITRIEPISTRSAPSATGAVLGGLVGAVAGREIADDHTDSSGRKNAATIGGAAAGALAGNAIQKSVSTKYNIYVRMDDGRNTVVTVPNANGLQAGAAVRVNNGRVYAR